MQVWLEQLGVAVAALTGVLAARGKRVDLFGVIVLAVVTAFGGGTVRDLMLGSLPIFWVHQPLYLLNATSVAFVWFFLARRFELPRILLLVADAGALALFTVVGVKKALVFHTPPSAAVAMGVITGVAGGILRDSLLGDIPLVFRQEIHLYATASLLGASAYVLLVRWLPGHEPRVMLLAVLAILVVRLAGIRWRLTLPEFAERKGDSAGGSASGGE